MGLDITIKRTRPIRCPDCGKVVRSETVDCVYSGGRDWYDYLRHIGYYTPNQEDCSWYGEDLALTAGQAKEMADFSNKHKCADHTEIEKLVAMALFHGDFVVINADW